MGSPIYTHDSTNIDDELTIIFKSQDMNDDPSSSSSGAYTSHADTSQEASPTAAELAERRKKNRQLFNRKRGDLLDDLLRHLDILIYAELSTIYYMDCSFLRFLFRAFVQFVFLTLKQAPFSEHAIDRPMIAPLVTSNLLCILFHTFGGVVEAGEDTRGYLHGGLAMDFIGQKGPSGKVHLVVLDLLVLGLQVMHMAAGMARRKLRDAPKATPAGAVSETSQSTTSAEQTDASQQQDLDSEERGVHRADYGADTDIEMQPLNPSGTTTVDPTSSSSSSDALLATTTPRTDAHIFDAFNSGQIVLADLDLWKHIKEQWDMVKHFRANPESAQASSRSLRAELASRMLRLRIGTDALRQSI